MTQGDPDRLRWPSLQPARRAASRWDRLELALFSVVIVLACVTPPYTAEGAPNSPLQVSTQETTGGGLCPFKRFTGVDCGGCGMTRAFVQLGHGHALQAVQLNPLSPVVFLWVLLRCFDLLAFNLFARRIDLGLSRGLMWKLWTAFFVLFCGLSGWRLASALIGSGGALGAL